MIFLLLTSILIQLGLSLGKCSHHIVIRLKLKLGLLRVTVCVPSDISNHRLHLVNADHKYFTVSIELFSNVFSNITVATLSD